MKPEVKSVTIYVREEQFERFMKGEYDNVVWTLTSGDPSGSGYFSHKQVRVQISVDTYYNMLDARKGDDTQLNLPF
jgi:hypothetical protein